MGRSSLSVALIGSSGGGSATLTSQAILENLQKEFESIEGATVNLVSWILCRSESGFDFATNETPTSLLASTTCRNDIVDGNLNEINRMAQLEDAQLAGLIRSGRIDALVSISADPEGVNKASTSAAIAKQIPIVGTGGTSISALSLSGAHVIGSSGGSVSTTAISKSICFASSLASYWNLLYKRRRPSFLSIKLQSILGAALPMLLAVNIFKLLLPMSIEWCMSFTADSFICGDTNIQSLLMSGINIILPITLSVISCSEVSRLGELSMICGAAAGAMYSVVVITLRNSDQLLVSIINGAICGYTLESFLIICASYSILPTATTIIAMGLSSIISGSISILLSAYVLPYWYSSSVVTMIFTLYNNFILQFVLKSSARRRLFGAFLGYMVSWGSENGYYHSIMLPIIAFQMQGGEFSSAGAFDLVCLCLPCAGVCLAIFLLALTNSCKLKNSAIDMGKQRNMGWKGFISNFLFGDFVEACYPYTLNHPYSVLFVIRIACMFAGSELLNWSHLHDDNVIKSSAYLPVPFSFWQIHRSHSISSFKSFTIASSIAFLLPFLVTYRCYYDSGNYLNNIKLQLHDDAIYRGREKFRSKGDIIKRRQHMRSTSTRGKRRVTRQT